MPKLACPCGYIHNLSPIPDHGWVTVRDQDYEALVEAEVAMHAGDQERVARSVELTGLLYECPECGRLMWQRPGEDCFAVFCRES
jgi:hypothetical protein